MYIDVDAHTFARKGVFRLQGLLDWCAGQDWVGQVGGRRLPLPLESPLPLGSLAPSAPAAPLAPSAPQVAVLYSTRSQTRSHRLTRRQEPSIKVTLYTRGDAHQGETPKATPGALPEAGGMAPSSHAAAPDGHTPAPNTPGGEAGGRAPQKNRTPKSKEPLNQVQTVFLYFIAHGVLPTAHSTYTLNGMQAKLLEQLQQEPHFFGAPSGGSEFCLQLLDLLLTNRSALPRLLAQFGEGLLLELYAHTAESGIVSRWVGWMSDVPHLDTRTLRWKTLLLSLSYTGGRISLDNYSKVEKGIVLYLLREMQPTQLFRWVGQLPPVNLEKLLGALDIPHSVGADLSELLSTIREQTTHLVTPVAPGLDANPAPGSAPGLAGDPAPVLARGTKLAAPLPTVTDAGVYVDNAGLVLLHPFLSALFQELGWADGMGFVQPNFHQRAVLLTQYLVHPADIFPEYQLRLNKLLCGYPLEDTLPLHPDEDAAREHEKAVQLLQNVLRQWTLNGQPANSSIQGLRDSWLRRRGKLVRREHYWVLQVEQKAFDVILNSLSWNTRMIQLPWMQEVLWVEWV